VEFKFGLSTESRDKHNIGFREFVQRFCDALWVPEHLKI
jgi:hypothetical protein